MGFGTHKEGQPPHERTWFGQPLVWWKHLSLSLSLSLSLNLLFKLCFVFVLGLIFFFNPPFIYIYMRVCTYIYIVQHDYCNPMYLSVPLYIYCIYKKAAYCFWGTRIGHALVRGSYSHTWREIMNQIMPLIKAITIYKYSIDICMHIYILIWVIIPSD